MENEIPNDTPPAPAEVVDTKEKPEVDPKTKKFVTMWVSRIKAAKKHPKNKEAFKRMDECTQLAKDGASKDWIENGKNFVVPILNRHINTQVAHLYAKNPKAYAKRKERRMFKVWDGTLQALQEAEAQVAMAKQMPPTLDPMTGQLVPAQPDPNAMAIVQDAQQVKAYDVLMDGMANTITLLHNYYMQEQSAQYKQQFKALVRRAKVCSVGYVKLSYQRILEKNPDISVKIDETTEKLATLKRLLAEQARDETDEESAEAEQLRTMLADLQTQEDLIVKEGPMYTFPKPKSIIIDPQCIHLKTLAGADWYAEEWTNKTPEDIEEDYGVDVTGNFTAYTPDKKDMIQRWSDKTGDEDKGSLTTVWRVMNRRTAQEFTICDGHDDYLKPPAPPAVKLARFWDIFPLVFNEIESEDDLFPPSDIWQAKHIQDEYNRSREGLREHRLMNRPAWLTPAGTFEDKDLNKLEAHPLGAIIGLNGIAPGDKIQDKIMAKPIMPIDPKQYEVESLFTDMQRTVGTSEANLGGTSGATATESSIAEASVSASKNDQTDDLDDLLSLLAQATGQVMLLNISKETVESIVGPGAVWPEAPQTREELSEEITLDVRAGSSGRPNQAAELAKRERAMPFLLQLPTANPLAKGLMIDYLELLDIDIDARAIEGLPSIQAQNATAGAAVPPGGDPAAAPGAQGGEGGQNAPVAPGTPPGPQPAFPAPTMSMHHPA